MKVSNRTRKAVAQSQRGLLALAVLGVLLAAWLAWTGWQQLQDGARRSQLGNSRDALAQSTARSLRGELERLEERMASQPVRDALAARDFEAAAAALALDWPNLQYAAVEDPALAEAYA